MGLRGGGGDAGIGEIGGGFVHFFLGVLVG